MLSIVSSACWPSYIFLGKMSIQVFHPFFNWVVGFLLLIFLFCLYILEIKPLSVASFETIFSHSVRFFFVAVVVFNGFLYCAKAFECN